jgi:hypothetical protein
MTETTTQEVAPIQDFSRARNRILFRIDGDVFEAASALPAEVLVEFGTRFADVQNTAQSVDEQFAAFAGVLELVLLPDSYEAFRARLRDRAHPIDLDQLQEVIIWLIEKHGMRPTRPSSDSSPGSPSPASGTSSTDGALAAISIPLSSPQLVS